MGDDLTVHDVLPRARAWAQTMQGHGSEDTVRAHHDSRALISRPQLLGREAREEHEARWLSEGATLAHGAGNRAIEEEPDPERTCFERDRDRIVHSTAFRRLAGKTQVVVYPRDHQRTRLTHAIEVAQVATSIARLVGANACLADAIALGHDCGHGPGGHASEDAFDLYIEGGYDHGPWGADVVLTSLNLCRETLDGIRNHSWSRPAPMTVEGEIVSWSDRIAYCAHDLEDAVHAGVVDVEDLPEVVKAYAGLDRRTQLGSFIHAIAHHVETTGEIGMDAPTAEALAALRRFNYEWIYTRPDAQAQSLTVVKVLRGLVDLYIEQPHLIVDLKDDEDLVTQAVTYVGGMTDRFAFEKAEELLGWDPALLPRGIGRGA